ncbi:MAG: peptidylprolyl isomerase [Ignavibacteriaceae bacterium]
MKVKTLLIFISLFATVNAQEVLDKIVAVVGDQIILKSELDFQTAMFAAQRKVDASSPVLREKILNTMIEDKLVYTQATIDSIIVSDDEIDQRIDYQIEVFKQQYGSIDNIENIYGMSIERIRRELRDEVRKNIMVQRLQDKKFAGVSASRKEVEEFFEQYKDSLGIIPEKVTIYHIFRNPKASEESKEKFRKFASDLLDSIRNGADFSELAKKYSEDPGSASFGGDLGFVKRGVFYPEFEAAAFALEEGEISDVVESPVGFHIIEMLEKRGESVHVRHILIKIKTDDEADLNTIEFLTEIRDSIVNGYGSFSDFAKKYSQDEQTKSFGGKLGSFYISQLDKALTDAISNLKAGEISFPRRIEYSASSYGYHIVYLEERIPQHPADLDIDYNEIKKLADEQKRQELYEQWIAELKDKIFWEVRL